MKTQPQSDDSAHRAEAARYIGEALGDRRRSLGLSIDDIALKLKFMPRQLEALEAGRFERLPGTSFVRGMIRSYARALDLDPESLLIRLPADAPSVDSLAEFVKDKPIPITDTSRGVNLLYGAFSLIIAGVIAAVVWEWQAERSASERMTFVRPTEQAAPRAEPVARTEPIAVATTKLPPVPVEGPASAPPASAPQGAPSADVTSAPGNRRITLVFRQQSWVQVRGSDGKVLISQLNAAGSEQVLEGRPPFDLVIGNAPHVRVRYDDRDVDLAPHMKLDVARLKLE